MKQGSVMTPCCPPHPLLGAETEGRALCAKTLEDSMKNKTQGRHTGRGTQLLHSLLSHPAPSQTLRRLQEGQAVSHVKGYWPLISTQLLTTLSTWCSVALKKTELQRSEAVTMGTKSLHAEQTCLQTDPTGGMHTTTGTRSTFNEPRMGSPRVPNWMCPSTEAEQGMKKEFQTLSSKHSFSTWSYKNTRLHGKFFSVLLKRKQNKSIWT